MLTLRNVTKVYDAGAMRVEALRGIDLAFRPNEFVAVLGPSGCGKTTLLNIVGGLDRATGGELYVNGKSTRRFRDGDWDTYRNHAVGFVFQSYNLIPHQTALANVELALTLAGVSKGERRQRAADMLARVGLADQVVKLPSQMSGGQMQRVAIARALINDPDILLADEPTGALDSETSVEVLDILKEVAKERLVIMVTHNAEFAQTYATRIVRLQDGVVVSDSDPYGEPQVGQAPSAAPTGETAAKAGAVRAASRRDEEPFTPVRPSMSFGTALDLSFNNLWTKKTRTLLTAFAGSIGIVGIALILSLSAGFRNYIAQAEEDMLATYPITIEREAMAADMGAFQGGPPRPVDVPNRRDDVVYVNSHMSEMVDMRVGQIRRNDLGTFKAYLDARRADVADDVAAISYGYDVKFSVYKVDGEATFSQVHPSRLLDMLGLSGLMQAAPGMSAMMAGFNAWEELAGDARFLESRYELVAGAWPRDMNDLLLVVNRNNEIFETALFGLGLADPTDMAAMVRARMPAGAGGGRPLQAEAGDGPELHVMDDLLQLRYRLVPEARKYARSESGAGGLWENKERDRAFMAQLLAEAPELRLAGIVRPKDEDELGGASGFIGYLPALTDYVIDATWEAPVVQAQLARPDVNVLKTTSERDAAGFALGNSAAEALATLGAVDREQPHSIKLYTRDFAGRSNMTAFIATYNETQRERGEEDKVITYTDFIRLILSSVTDIVDGISSVLIAFVAISLLVSSIMIGVIGHISVLERVKEIGILRSLGASKRDVRRVFNAETLLVGLAAGVLGVGLSGLLTIPINMLIQSATGAANVAALPPTAAAVLIGLSMLLTRVAGILPARAAARQDPVEALRAE